MCTRILCVAAFSLLATFAAAQDGLRSASLPERTPQNPIPPPRSDQFLAGPDTYRPRHAAPPRRHGHRHHVLRSHLWFPAVVTVPVPFAHEQVEGFPRDVRDVEANGYLRLEVEPASAQVFVDGLFVGSGDDFRRLTRGRELPAGRHRVELRAPGHETIAFDVRIFPNETITFRHTLRAQTAVPAQRPSPGIPKTFYVIPGCYAGDKPPRQDALDGRCDASSVRTVTPASVANRR